jgi:8-hydroxy-5-deazaflavin:NADPH oxidoreductase
MNIGILGTGMVGQTIGEKLVKLGHGVKLGSRTSGNEKAGVWAQKVGANGSTGTFAETAAFGEIVFNCTSGSGSLEALAAAGAERLKDKILIDVAVPLDFSKGMPPTLFSGNTDSLGEAAQRLLPETKVVKTLNTVNCMVMVDPQRVGGGEHDMFMAGNDAAAKATVAEHLRVWFGWKSVIDLGDISAARGTESYLPLWLRLWGATKSADFNIRVVR